MSRSENTVPVQYGTLDMLIMRTLSWGTNHGFGIIRHIELMSGDELHVEEGALYPALHRMHRKGWIEAQWGVSDRGRRARFYRLTSRGKKELGRQVGDWRRSVAVTARILEATPA